MHALETMKKNMKTIGIIVLLIGSAVAVHKVVQTLTKPKPKRLSAIAFHVQRKGDMQHVYDQIIALNQGKYSVFLMPEWWYSNFEETLNFLREFENEYSIPIMLEVFCSLEFSPDEPYKPPYMLNQDQIKQAMDVCNVLWLRFSEVAWYHKEKGMDFPYDYARSILEFCRKNGLKLFWSEWDIKCIDTVRSSIKGFENIVTVAFATNSYVEPNVGFTVVNEFQHWGASVQAWYWWSKYGYDPINMPIDLMIKHTLLARNMGAEIIQFEPYWYFFDNGEGRESLERIVRAL